jgi:ABC-type transport system substrate-binding protein
MDARGRTGADNPFTKLEVRRAVNHAIDRQAIVDSLIRGDWSEAGQVALLAFATHWLLIATVAVWWPTLIREAGRDMTVEAGRDDRGVA